MKRTQFLARTFHKLWPERRLAAGFSRSEHSSRQLHKRKPLEFWPATVAQVCNLLYRRFAIGRALKPRGGSQVENLRYGRLKICATPFRAAWGICQRTRQLHKRKTLESWPAIVAQVCNLLYRRFAIGRALKPRGGSQVANLRYSRLKICATPFRAAWGMCRLAMVICALGLAAAPLARADFSATNKPPENLRAKTAVQVAALDRSRILKLADQALALKPPAITDAVATNSAGGPHDYFSQADYYWPNPTNQSGLPYVNRDGESNPGTFTAHRMAMRQMKDAVAALAAAYALTGNDRYAAKAAELLRVFFLDEKTRMNPNLSYAQAILGRSTGERSGIIDTLHLAEVAVAIPFLEKSPALPPSVAEGLKQWFADYTRWLTTSEFGLKEMNNANNHSVACFVQLVAFAKLTGDQKLLALSRQRLTEVLLPRQMTNNGSFPLELKRTKPYGYSIFQADNVAILCDLLSTPHDDLWQFRLPDGRTPLATVDFLYPYLADKNKWLAAGYHRDVSSWDHWPVRQSCLLFAYVETGDKKYFDLWKKLDADPTDLEIRRNLAITQPLLWIARPDEIPLLKRAKP